MRVKIAVAFFWLLTANPALSENVASQFSASKQPLDEWLMLWTLSLTSKADVLEIQKLTINRGCELNPSIKFPITLKFGQTFTLNALKCNPIEVSIETPNGTQTMTWAGDAKSSLAVQNRTRR